MEARKLSESPASDIGLSLRIRHPSIDPAEISRELQLQPEHSFRAGDPRNSSSGLAATATHAESYWLGALTPFEWLSPFSGTSISVDGMLAVCAAQLSRRHAAFFNRIVNEGGQIGLLVEITTDAVRSFAIPPAISRALSELGIALEFEFEAAG